MVLVRVVTVLGIGLSAIVILLQNQSPRLALVFLGMRSHPLSIGLWVAGAIGCGALLGLGLFGILSLATPAVSAPRPARHQSRFRWPRFKFPRPQPRGERPNRNPPPGYSDWDQPPATDWGGQPARSQPFFDDEYDNEYDDAYDDDPINDFDDHDYGEATPPWAKRDSAYSYSAYDPDFADQSGQRDSVFDAEYRVINPPERHPSPPADGDDYGEFADD